MKQLKYIRFTFIFFTLVSIAFFISCNKEEDQPADTGAIKIISLTATDIILKAWMDTTAELLMPKKRFSLWLWLKLLVKGDSSKN